MVRLAITGRRLDTTFLHLVNEAAVHAYNRKPAFRQFLRRCGVSTGQLALCSDQETKRNWLDRILPHLESSESGQITIRNMADALIRQTAFPDLKGWEDSDRKIEMAKQSIADLQEYLTNEKKEETEQKEQAEWRASAELRRQDTLAAAESLQTLRARIDALATDLGTQTAGYAFQDWFYDLCDFFEVESRRPFVTHGRQIDGSVTVDGTTYLVELRFKREQAGGPDIDGLLSRVNSKADNTMGLFVAMAGYNDGAFKTASFAKTPLMLIDYSHLYHILSGAMMLSEVVRRIRRHASQTGEAFLEISRFGG
jgi:hypothetical protein